MSTPDQADTPRDPAPRAHHPDCPALFFTDHPERCRCMFLAMLDRPRRSTCPRCGEQKFVGHGPLCSDCYSGPEVSA